ncbi:protein of unknown function (plasmid) [Rhodovastum atsumiense]|uniref:IS66 family transposase n=1 Tax=Rhodovastum atsumiense TaxID=504468 RepID=UPI00204AA84E|nr:transposase [Rhodovastum atsumiense]CAH2606392.1 protein of unknown function [Rhodovastum atsumiense]
MLQRAGRCSGRSLLVVANNVVQATNDKQQVVPMPDKAMNYMLKRWDTFSRFLDDGRICLSNNAVARALRGIALGRKAWLFAGSDRGDERAAAMYSLLITVKLNDIYPQAWLADVLARIADHPASRLHELLPWNWRRLNQHGAYRRLIAIRGTQRMDTQRAAHWHCSLS